MARKFLVPVDLNKNELRNAVIQSLGSAPGSPVAGLIYFDTSTSPGKLLWYNGSAWVDPTTGSIADGTLALAKLVSGTSAQIIVANGSGVPAYVAMSGDVTITNAGVTAIGALKVTNGMLAGSIANSKLATDPLARANHTGTQTASTISDFDTQVRTSRLDQMAAPTADVSMGSHKLTNVTDPTSAQDAATKAYVDATAQGLDIKASVRAATTANGTLATAYANGQVVDGVTLATGDRILIKNQTTGSENGIYVVAASGAPARATDADVSAEVTPGMFTFVEEGTTNDNSGWVLTTNAPITLGTTALVFTQFTGTGMITAGNGLVKSGNVISVGAGTGIAVGASTTSVDRTGTNGAHVPLKYAADIGDGSSVAIVVTHSLGTKDCVVQVFDNTTPFAQIECDVEHTSTTTVTVRFTTAPTSAQYRIVIFG